MRLLCKTVSKHGRRRAYPASAASPQRLKIIRLDRAWVNEGNASPTGIDDFNAGNKPAWRAPDKQPATAASSRRRTAHRVQVEMRIPG